MSVRQIVRCTACLALAVLSGPVESAAQTGPRAGIVADGASNPASVPAWLAWTVFHHGLTTNAQTSGASVDLTLAVQFGLDAAEASALRAAGPRFAAAIARIDSDARATVQARYGTDRRPRRVTRAPGRDAVAAEAASERPIVLERGKTLLDMVRASGLYAQVESRKDVALAQHVAELQRALDAESFARLRLWVLGPIASNIRVVDRGRPAPPVDRSAGDGPSGYVKRQDRER